MLKQVADRLAESDNQAGIVAIALALGAIVVSLVERSAAVTARAVRASTVAAIVVTEACTFLSEGDAQGQMKAITDL